MLSVVGLVLQVIVEMGIARLLIGLNNKNPESDIGVNAERSEKQSSKRY